MKEKCCLEESNKDTANFILREGSTTVASYLPEQWLRELSAGWEKKVTDRKRNHLLHRDASYAEKWLWTNCSKAVWTEKVETQLLKTKRHQNQPPSK